MAAPTFLACSRCRQAAHDGPCGFQSQSQSQYQNPQYGGQWHQTMPWGAPGYGMPPNSHWTPSMFPPAAMPGQQMDQSHSQFSPYGQSSFAPNMNVQPQQHAPPQSTSANDSLEMRLRQMMEETNRTNKELFLQMAAQIDKLQSAQSTSAPATASSVTPEQPAATLTPNPPPIGNVAPVQPATIPTPASDVVPAQSAATTMSTPAAVSNVTTNQPAPTFTQHANASAAEQKPPVPSILDNFEAPNPPPPPPVFASNTSTGARTSTTPASWSTVVRSNRPAPGRHSGLRRMEMRPHELTDEQISSAIRSDLKEAVVPYAYELQECWDILQKWGDPEMDMSDHALSEVSQYLPEADMKQRGFHQMGTTRKKEFAELNIKCNTCTLLHPTDTCGYLYETWSSVHDRDPQISGPEADLMNPKHMPCATCSNEGFHERAKYHFSSSCGKGQFYDHPDNANILDVIRVAQKPEEVVKCVQYSRPWPKELIKKFPLPLYCFDKAKAKPAALPSIPFLLRSGMREATEDVAAAIKRCIDMQRAQNSKASRGGKQPKPGLKPEYAQHMTPPDRPGFGGAQTHARLSCPSIKEDGIYLISEVFVREVETLFIPEHSEPIQRLIKITKHYFDYARIFKDQPKVINALRGQNKFLWTRFLKPYAEAWSPGRTTLDEGTIKKLQDDFAALGGLENPRPNAFSLFDREVTEDDKKLAVRCRANPDAAMLGEGKAAAEVVETEDGPVSGIIKEYEEKDIAFDPMESELRTNFPPVPKTGVEVAAQIKHFDESFGKTNISPDTVHRASQIVDDEINATVRLMQRQARAVNVNRRAAAADAISSHQKSMNLIYDILTSDYLGLHRISRGGTMDDFTTLQQALGKIWNQYYKDLEDTKKALLEDEAFVECLENFSDPEEAAKFWSVLMANVMPCEMNKDAPLRLLAWSKTISAHL